MSGVMIHIAGVMITSGHRCRGRSGWDDDTVLAVRRTEPIRDRVVATGVGKSRIRLRQLHAAALVVKAAHGYVGDVLTRSAAHEKRARASGPQHGNKVRTTLRHSGEGQLIDLLSQQIDVVSPIV